MASPRSEVFFLYDPATGAPKTGVAGIAFTTYKDELGSNILPQPAITEIGGGAYAFTPVLVANKGIVYVINAGVTAMPQYTARYIRAEDWYTDNSDSLSSAIQTTVDELQVLNTGKWTIDSTTSIMTLYASNGSTILYQFQLQDAAGTPTSVNPYRRIPIP